jgi:hypothetical protein
MKGCGEPRCERGRRNDERQGLTGPLSRGNDGKPLALIYNRPCAESNRRRGESSGLNASTLGRAPAHD